MTQPSLPDTGNIWSEDLSDAQLSMLIASGDRCLGVEVRGGGWRTARSLEAKGLGKVLSPIAGPLPSLFFGNAEAVRILHEFDDDTDVTAQPLDKPFHKNTEFDHGEDR